MNLTHLIAGISFFIALGIIIGGFILAVAWFVTPANAAIANMAVKVELVQLVEIDDCLQEETCDALREALEEAAETGETINYQDADGLYEITPDGMIIRLN